MNLVDSCGWLEYFADGPDAAFFAPPLEHTADLLVPSICVLEVFKRVLTERGEGPALQAAAAMQQGLIADLDLPTALAAAGIGNSFGLPLADSVILATARRYKAVIWTQDSHFKNIQGVKYREKTRKKK
ncbi:MAG TPA: type II toxin-antitoxin system VapC family toxin [bacterium]|nr:type II toxin-antitoxin system VapC family toxin [bacterium]